MSPNVTDIRSFLERSERKFGWRLSEEPEPDIALLVDVYVFL